jgi:excinuclease ABC subunit B
VNGRAILYADRITGSIERALAETGRRRAKQIEHNAAHGITPMSIRKAVTDVMEGARGDVESGGGRRGAGIDTAAPVLGPEQAMKRIRKLETEMHRHARNLDFEQAAQVRDEIERLRHQAFGPPGALAG